MHIIHSVNYIFLLFSKAFPQQATCSYKYVVGYYLLSSSVEWAPFLINMSNLNLSTRLLSSFIRMHRPIRVAKEQCGTVGLNSMRTTCTSPSVDGFIWTNRRHSVKNQFIYSFCSIFTGETDQTFEILLFPAILNTQKLAYKTQKLEVYLWWIHYCVLFLFSNFQLVVRLSFITH